MNILDRLMGKKRDDEDGDGSLEPFSEGQLNEEKKEMIRGVVDLSETAVKEVMIPRIDVDAFPVDISRDELLEKIAVGGHSRFPVYDETIDNIIGVIYVKDLIRSLFHNEPIDLAALARKPFFVPESKRIDSLLREFKRRHVHIAIAIDEYGGMSGIVCMEDIIEEIVGDIQDEFDNEQEDILSLGENVWLCDARINVEDLNHEIGSAFPEEEFETLGGFVFDLFGKIPVKYEKISNGDYDFIVQDIESHRINTVKIIRRKEELA